jgi:hypothetical protein
MEGQVSMGTSESGKSKSSKTELKAVSSAKSSERESSTESKESAGTT